MFSERLDTALDAARRHNRLLALLFLDINDFKEINDNHGHSVGDRVLCTLARRLEGCVGAADTVARMGGDEFTVLLPDCPSPEAIAEQVAHILAAMAEPLGAEFAGIDVPSCSIGVACFPEDGNDADMLLRHADGHMYQIKRQRTAAG
ncbi:putative diguanylate cyclase YdaM [compost metagenome]